MQFSSKTVAFAASLLSTAQGAALLGFNYGATKTDGSLMQQSDYESLFTKAQNLAGTSGWNSARLYTSIQGSTGQPISAIPAAIATNTKLLLGLWGSSGDDTIKAEIAAIQLAISQHGSSFTDLVVGVSVGSEDLYRDSIIGVQTKAGIGADPATIANYITQTKQALSSTALKGVKVGHVDTWTAWYNTSNQAVIDASDFIGVDTYPYFQNTMANSIDLSKQLFDEAVANTRSTTNGKEIWITETGFPTGGPTSNQAVPSKANAKTYWDVVGCGELFNVTNTFWYTLQDEIAAPLPADSPKFGILDINGNEQFDLSCNNISKTPTSTASSSTASSTKASGTNSASIVDGGSPGVSQGGAGSAPGGVTATTSVTSATGTGAATTAPVSTTMTTTNSAGQVIVSTAVVNGTGIATGTPISPTASTTSHPATGAASVFVAPVVGVFGAVMAALVL